MRTGSPILTLAVNSFSSGKFFDLFFSQRVLNCTDVPVTSVRLDCRCAGSPAA